MARYGKLGTQYFDNAGDPLVAGKIFFFESGTDTDKDTFADVNLTILNSNPVILSGAGRQPNVFFNGTTRAILTDSDDVQIEVRDPDGAAESQGALTDWNSITVYDVNDIVEASNGKFYISRIDANQNNNPVTDPTTWSEFRLIHIWNTNDTYIEGFIVEASDGFLYTSLTAANSGNNPIGDANNWQNTSGANPKVSVFSATDSANQASNTSLVVVTPLILTTTKAGWWKVDAYLRYSVASNDYPTVGIRLAAKNTGADADGTIIWRTANGALLAGTSGDRTDSMDGSTGLSRWDDLSAGASLWTGEGLTFSSDASFDIEVYFAQDSSTATDTFILAGSYITAEWVSD